MFEESFSNQINIDKRVSTYRERIIIKNKLNEILNEINSKKIITKYFNNEINKEGFSYYISKTFRLNDSDYKEIDNYLSRLQSKQEIEVDNKGLVSIIITTYNRKQYLTDAINSILSQTYKNIEIIVMDDCSSDGTETLFNTIFTNENIFYYRNQENKGCGFSRSYAFNNYCKGKYVIFMDDDDFYIDNDYINKSVLIHESIDGLSFVSADTFIEYPDKILINELNNYDSLSNNEYFINFMKHGYKKPSSTFTTVFKKSILEKSGLNDMDMVNDTSIYLRSLLNGKPYFLNNIVGVYRMHGNNLTFSCSLQFIIDNLEEKYKVGILGKEVFNLNENEYRLWMFEQFYMTIMYYLNSSKPSIRSQIILLIWIKKKSIYLYKKFRKIFLRRYLKI